MKRLLRFFGLVPLHELLDAQVQANHYLWERNDAQAALAAVEKRMWLRYENRLKNDLHMTLSWLYTKHVEHVSMGQPETQAEGMWPYYRKSQMLTGAPAIEPEKII
jgi:uncharacterized protein (DUF2267 family)